MKYCAYNYYNILVIVPRLHVCVIGIRADTTYMFVIRKARKIPEVLALLAGKPCYIFGRACLRYLYALALGQAPKAVSSLKNRTIAPEYTDLQVINLGLFVAGASLDSLAKRWFIDIASFGSTLADLLRYVRNIIELLALLSRKLAAAVECRVFLGQIYKKDLMCVPDSLILESLVSLPPLEYYPTECKYRSRIEIHTEDKNLRRFINYLREETFLLDKSGHVIMPAGLCKTRIELAGNLYRFGIGGLHSAQRCVGYKGGLIGIDFVSFYPMLIINHNVLPARLEGIKACFQQIYEEKEGGGAKIARESFKLMLNSAFGRLGSKRSMLYSPESLLNITLTGQLLLISIIERLSKCGVHCVSANTDGVVLQGGKLSEIKAILEEFKAQYKLPYKITLLQSIFFRDVNNYLQFTATGAWEGRGVYNVASKQKKPYAEIVGEMLRVFLGENRDPRIILNNCQDWRKFAIVYDTKCLCSFVRENVFRGIGRSIVYVFVKKNGGMIVRQNGETWCRVPGATACLPVAGYIGIDKIDRRRYLDLFRSRLLSLGLSHYFRE